MIYNLDVYWSEIVTEAPESYEIPKVSDFKILLVFVPIISLLKIIIEKSSIDILGKYIL